MWTAAPTAVLVTLALAILLTCLATIYLVGRQRGRRRVKVNLFFGLGFTVDFSDDPQAVFDDETKKQSAEPEEGDEQSKSRLKRVVRRLRQFWPSRSG